MKYFNKKTFKIVGIVKSPMYMEKESRGTTTVGKGSIDYFAVVNKDDISMDAYTEIYVRFKMFKVLMLIVMNIKIRWKKIKNILKTYIQIEK